ncbi:hypothetical protein Tco_0692994 [Tanacetum coccineum]
MTSTQKPYAIRDFLRGIYEVGESSAARDSSYVSGLEPWALRHDLEATREKERKILDHDLGNVEKTLSNVVERLKILESRENATLKKNLEDKEIQLVIARMDCASAEQRLHESIGWNRRFYWEMVLKGAVPKPPFIFFDEEDDGHVLGTKEPRKSIEGMMDLFCEPRGPHQLTTHRS